MSPFTITQSQLVFESGGKSIRLDAYVPQASRERLPAVLALHGAGGGVAGMERYAAVLAAGGFAVYVLRYFDRTGTEYADKPTMMRNFPLWMKSLWDAISFVVTQPHVDPDRIALLGFSLGAYLALANSAIDPRVKAVVEFFGGMPKEMNFFMRRLCPVLILHGEADATVPVEEAYKLQRLMEKKEIAYEIKIYPGVGHGFEDQTIWRDAAQRSLQFLQSYVGADDSTASRPRSSHS
jgi:dienelactone hydrolase